MTNEFTEKEKDVTLHLFKKALEENDSELFFDAMNGIVANVFIHFGDKLRTHQKETMTQYNYKFVSDYAVVIITTDTDKNANAILKETVRDINHFRCDEIEEVGVQP